MGGHGPGGGGGAHWEALGNRGYQGTRPSLPAAAEVPPPPTPLSWWGCLVAPPLLPHCILLGGGGGLVNQPPRGDLCLGCVSSKPAFSGGVRFGGNPLYTPPPQEHLPWGSPTTLLEVSALGGESLQTLLGVLSPRRGLPSQQWDLPRVVGRGHIPPPPPQAMGLGVVPAPGGSKLRTPESGGGACRSSPGLPEQGWRRGGGRWRDIGGSQPPLTGGPALPGCSSWGVLFVLRPQGIGGLGVTGPPPYFG